MNNKRVVIVGATSAIAEHCSRIWLKEQPLNLVLIGRHQERLERVCTDLKVRSPDADIEIVTANFLEPDAIQLTVDSIADKGPVDLVLIAQGALPDQNACQNNLNDCYAALEINALSPVLFAEAFARKMEQYNRGKIAIIGSVAGDLGRKSNYVYGAGKGLVERYVQGLQHRFAHTEIKAILIKPGPTDTPMTSQMKGEGLSLAPVETVAEQIVKGIAANKRVIYTPGKWWLIMMIIRHLPKWIFNKLNI